MPDQFIQINNLSRPLVRPILAKWCASFVCRLRGFTFRHKIEIEEGLVLVEQRDSRIDSSIHMMFLWTDLAVIWINSDKTVVDVITAKAWAPGYFPAQPARYTLEIHPSRAGEFQPGDKVEFNHV